MLLDTHRHKLNECNQTLLKINGNLYKKLLNWNRPLQLVCFFPCKLCKNTLDRGYFLILSCLPAYVTDQKLNSGVNLIELLQVLSVESENNR